MGIKSLACPMSNERIDKNVVRSSAIITAVIIASYSVLSLVSTASVFILMLLLAGDYAVRMFTHNLSPIGWLGHQLTRRLRMTPKQMDKAPKIFAVRVGFIFAASSVGLFFVDPTIAIGVGLALLTFNLLDGVLDIRVGCYFYTYVSLPLFGQK